MKLHEIEISPDIVDLLPRMVDPRRTHRRPGGYQHLLMCEAARERGVKVILSGMGADDCSAVSQAPGLRDGEPVRRLPGLPRTGLRFAVDRVPVTLEAGACAIPVGQALYDLRRAARGAAVPPKLHAVRPGQSGRAAGPDLRKWSARSSTGTAPSTPTTHWTTRSTGCAWPTRGCSWPGSTWPTLTGRLWPPPSRCGSRSWTRSWRGGVRDPGAGQDHGPARSSPSKGPRNSGSRRDRVPARRPPSVPRSAGGSQRLAGAHQRRACRWRARWPGMIRTGTLDRLIQDEQAGREDNAKQIWQLLTMELWYRNVRSMATPHESTKDAMKHIARTINPGSSPYSTARSGVPSRWRPRTVTVLPDFHRHRDHEGPEASMSMAGMARARPDQVRKVLDTVAQQGAMAPTGR